MLLPMGSVIRLVAMLCSGIVLLGFALFAIDEMGRGSQNQQNALAAELEGDPDEAQATIAPGPREELLRERRNGDFRELVDDANDVLLLPFGGLVDSESPWVAIGVPTALGLVFYGLLLGLLANLLPSGRRHGADWRAADC